MCCAIKKHATAMKFCVAFNKDHIPVIFVKCIFVGVKIAASKLFYTILSFHAILNKKSITGGHFETDKDKIVLLYINMIFV